VLETRDAVGALELARRFPLERRYGEIAAILTDADPAVPPALKLEALERARANDPYSPRLAFWRMQTALQVRDHAEAKVALDLMRRTAPLWPQTREAALRFRWMTQ